MFTLASVVSLVSRPYVMSKVMNIVQTEGIHPNNLPRLMWLLVGVFMCTVAFWILHGPARVMEQNNAFLLRLNYRKFFLWGVTHLPMQWHSDHHSGDTIDRIEKGTGALYLFASDSYELLYTFVKLIVCYGVLTYFNPTAGLIALFFIVISAMITIKIDSILVKNYTILARGENAASKGVFDMLSNITTVIILRVEKHVFDAVISKIRAQTELTSQTNRLAEFKWFLTSLCCAGMSVSVLASYMYTQSKSSIPVLIGSVYLLLAYLDNVDEVFYRFTSFYSNIVKWRVRANNAEELAVDFSPHDFDSDKLPDDWQNIDIRGLSFAYQGSGVDQLNNINLQLHRGSKVALIGVSGGGKTTLLKVIRNLYEPRSGEVRVDGRLCQNWFGDFSESVALLPQNPEIFDATVLHNITLGADYPMELIQQAMKVACFDEVLPNLPRGLESLVNEKGVNLSGGQNQRLALIRGILASGDKPVVLLDEPTSSLDMVTEHKVFERLFKLFEGKLIISTLHRLHLLPLFNHIVLFDDGRIIAQGSLEHLLKTCPQFQYMWKMHGGE